MNTESLILYADSQPMKGITNPLPNQIYRNPCLEVKQRELGTVGDNDIRIEMLYAGICGTDVHLASKNPDNGYIMTSAPLEIPPEGRIIGHEGIGRAVVIGKNVRHINTGDYLTFESIDVCHHCDMCRKGLFNQCRNAKLVGLQSDGLFSTFADIPGSIAHKINDYIRNEHDLQAFACMEPAAVAYIACQNARVRGGDKIVIFGGGPIGLFCAILAKTIFGASEIHIVEPIPFRRKFAERWCDAAYDIPSFFKSPPDNIDVLIEASGELDNINRIFCNVNANGRVIILARSGVPLVLEATDHMITNAISITGSRGHLCGAFNDLINLYHKNRFPLGAAITGVIDGLPALKDLLNSREIILQENCKILVKLSENR